MAAHKGAAIPPAARKTLIEWIEQDDGDTPASTQPACSAKLQSLHANLVPPPERGRVGERLQPPPGFNLAPLG